MLPYTDPDGTYHEIYRADLFLGAAYLGQFEFDSGRADLRWPRRSVAYFCPECGDVWGRMVFTDTAGRTRLFEVVHVACERHLDQWEVPGSFLIPRLLPLIDLFPPAAAKREAVVHLNKELA